MKQELKNIKKLLSLLEYKYREWYLVKNKDNEIWIYRSKKFDSKYMNSWSFKLLTPDQVFLLNVFQKYSYKNKPIKIKTFLRRRQKIELVNGIVKGVNL